MRRIIDTIKGLMNRNTMTAYPSIIRANNTLLFLIVFTFGFLGIVSYFFISHGMSQKQQEASSLSISTAVTQTASPSASSDPLHPQTPYYGVNVDMSQLLPGSSNYRVNSKGQDYIDIAHHLGITLFRITNVTSGFNNVGQIQIFTQKQWNQVLNKMAIDNIKAIILIESPSSDPTYYSDAINNSYLTLVQQYVLDSNVGKNPDVIGFDLKNEPDLTQNNLAFIQKAALMIKGKYPNMPVTVGGWKVANGNFDKNGNPQYAYNNPSDGALLSNINDFYSVHIYGFDKKNILGQFSDPYNLATQYLSSMVQISGGKPILVEEFGASNGTTVTDQQTVGSMELQANVYDGMYRAINDFHSQGVMGSSAFLYTQSNIKPDSWAIMSKDGNTLYPAAYVLQKYATGKSDIPLSLPYTSLPGSYVEINESNGTTLSVHPGDNIGFTLTLPKDTYLFTTDNQNIVKVTQDVYYDSSHNLYEATVHLKNTGIAKVNFYNAQSCTSGSNGCSGDPAYSLTLNSVQ